MDESVKPVKIKLEREKSLKIEWSDGKTSIYPIAYLRSQCPCATCRQSRESQKKSRLTVLPAGFTSEIHAITGQIVGNYALRIDWSDNHGSGIYSFRYLHEIAPE